MHDIENAELELAFGFLQNTGETVFLTGKAGTGKTTFLHNLKKISQKRMVVLAPTGVAAINAGGATIHSFFQMPFGPQIPGSTERAIKPAGKRFRRFSREKLNIIRSLDLLVIDEISMVRADLLDGIDEVLRRYRDYNQPFGGLQLLMIGDLQQLAPVVKEDEWELLSPHYDTPFFFSSRALQQSNYVTIELKRIYRQTDKNFVDLLNKVRYGDKDPETLVQINKRYKPGYSSNTDCGIILTTHNYQAQRINDEKMRVLSAKPQTFTAQVDGDFPEYSYPTDLNLILKNDAQVMFVKNDSSPDKRYFNGRIGTVQAIEDGVVYVLCPGDQSSIPVRRDVWQNMKYGLNSESGEIEETVTGTFTQYPLKAAWAITIHKSQGLTFDSIVLDASAAFAHGQIYVALSRCRTLEGLVLTSPLSPHVLISNSVIAKFNKIAEENQPGEAQLENARIAYQEKLLHDLFDFSKIQQQVSYCLKLINEHRGSIHSSVISRFETIAASIRCSIMDVAKKFNNQIAQLLIKQKEVEHNTLLQERVKKAAAYFFGKTDNIIGTLLQTCATDIDNKDIRKQLTEALELLDEQIIKKRVCLDVCREGFCLKSYLGARAKSAIEKPVAASSGQLSDQYENIAHPQLLEWIKSWRNDKADSMNLLPYMILQFKTMVEICTRLPASLKELKTVKGIGNTKVKNYGTELLKLIERYCSENEISFSIKDEPVEQGSQKAVKGSTKKISFDLFKSGKKIEEIAAERGLTFSTIEGHLSNYISTGELSVYQFLSSEKVKKICDFFESNNTRSLSSANNHFGDQASFGELRMVIGHLEYMHDQRMSIHTDS